jgi:hypothetical protein
MILPDKSSNTTDGAGSPNVKPLTTDALENH